MAKPITLDLMLALLTVPPEPRYEFCHDVNPRLWRAWCAWKGRFADPSYVWTEADVVQSCDMAIAERPDVRLPVWFVDCGYRP